MPSESGPTVVLTVREARTLVEASMRGVGHTQTEAEVIADHLIDCELRDLSFGGLPRALSIVERINAATVPRRPMTVLRENAFSATIDGGDQVGYLVGRKATDMALAKAKDTGFAVVGAYETWYTGMFSYYLEGVTKAGFVGLIGGSAPPRVAPYGGTQGRFGTNPIAFGFPSDGTPVIWDIGTSAIMSGEVMLAQRLGVPLPEGSAFNKDGQPTRDPGEALAGAFAVWGGHKGSGLAMSIQMLGMMCGAAGMPKGLRDCGFFILVINPGVLTDAEDYKKRIGEYASALRSSRPLDPKKPVRVPFERSEATRAAAIKADRIEVQVKVYDALMQVGAGT